MGSAVVLGMALTILRARHAATTSMGAAMMMSLMRANRLGFHGSEHALIDGLHLARFALDRSLQKALDTLDVGVAAEVGDERLDSGSDLVPLLGRLQLSHLERSLNDIVAKRMLQEADEGVIVGGLWENGVLRVRLELGELFGHHLDRVGVADLETLFDHVGAELLG